MSGPGGGRGSPPLPVPALVLWVWRASHGGLEATLIDPATGIPAPSGGVITGMLVTLGPVLAEYGEESVVEAIVGDIVREGTGAGR